MEQRTYRAFDTINMVQAHDCPPEVFAEIESAINRFERLFSHTLPSSELYRVNTAAGKPVRVDSELATLIAASLEYCELTSGLFDITMGPVVRLWNFKQGAVPARERIDEALAHVDYRAIAVDGDVVTLSDPDARIVLGGIAKGYIADELLAILARGGVRHAFVNLGGNVAVMGGKPDGSPFMVGVRSPVSTAEQEEHYLLAFPLFNGSMVTSGTYERCFERDGVLYHHILDPRTGMPAETDLLSATIIANRSIDADGFTTALIIMGLEKALEFIQAREGIEAVFVTTDKRIVMTSGITV